MLSAPTSLRRSRPDGSRSFDLIDDANPADRGLAVSRPVALQSCVSDRDYEVMGATRERASPDPLASGYVSPGGWKLRRCWHSLCQQRPA